MKTPYEVLGVSQNDTMEVIRKKFRKLSMQFHPDKSQDPNAEEKFKELNEAWGILSDPAKKSVLDDKLTKSWMESLLPVVEKAVESYLDGLTV